MTRTHLGEVSLEKWRKKTNLHKTIFCFLILLPKLLTHLRKDVQFYFFVANPTFACHNGFNRTGIVPSLENLKNKIGLVNLDLDLLTGRMTCWARGQDGLSSFGGSRDNKLWSQQIVKLQIKKLMAAWLIHWPPEFRSRIQRPPFSSLCAHSLFTPIDSQWARHQLAAKTFKTICTTNNLITKTSRLQWWHFQVIS